MEAEVVPLGCARKLVEQIDEQMAGRKVDKTEDDGRM